MSSSANALEQLIKQFTQPLAFLREVIQNSLDAATTQIEVEVGHDPDSDCLFVKITDNGHGMDRTTIDTRLTRLFASSKEDDLTKIGKFGIGFVSIFAIKPELVVLETGQHGEAWRILFLPDRSFERRELSFPVEGTCLTVFVKKKLSELESFSKECRETVQFWCKHSEVEILFNGQAINVPFELPGTDYQYHFQVEGTDAVLAPHSASKGFHGYYNRGLTLLEGVGSPIPYLQFKLRSRYLEHTLSRDNIRHDENYERALGMVREAARDEMPVDIFQKLASGEQPFLWEAAKNALKLDHKVRNVVQWYKVFPSRERRLALGDFAETILFGSDFDDLWLEGEARGDKILHLPRGDFPPYATLLQSLGHTLKPIQEEYFYFQRVKEPEREESALLRALRRATRQFLVAPVLLQTLNLPANWESRMSLFLNPTSRLIKVSDYDDDKGWFEAVGIRRDHPFWRQVVSLHSIQEELAVSLLVRMVNLELQVKVKKEAALMTELVGSIQRKASQ